MSSNTKAITCHLPFVDHAASHILKQRLLADLKKAALTKTLPK